MCSARDARLQIEDHIPKPVDLPPLNDLKGLEAVERLVRSIEPSRDGVRRHDFGKAVAETIQLFDPPEPWLAHRLPALPVRDSSLGKPGESGEHPAAETESPADRADGQGLSGSE